MAVLLPNIILFQYKYFYHYKYFRQHSNQECSDSKKSVTVQVGEKVKVPGQSSKKRIPSANLDLPRHGALDILTPFLL